jgi:hypothetical protein
MVSLQHNRVVASTWLFLGCVTVFVVSPVRDTTDSVYTLHTAISLARGHWGDLAPIDPNIASYSLTRTADGRILTTFPVGPSVLLAPFAWITDRLAPLWIEWFVPRNSFFVHRVIASLIGAATIVVLYQALLFRFDRRTALLLAITFAFATTVWSTTTRGLWSHGPLMLFVCIGLYCAFASQSARAAALTGAALAAAFAMRPTAAIAGVALAGVFGWRGLKPLACYALGGALVIAAWAALQVAIYGQVVPPYYVPSRIGSSATIEALLGNLVSPARGLFVFSPVLLFAIPGVFQAIRSPADRPWGLAITVAVVAHWIAISSFPHWWGGYSFGPRLMTDVLPFLILAVGYWLSPAPAHDGPSCSPTRRFVFPILLGLSMAVHAQGAWLGASRKWNDHPSIASHPERLWSWRDPQVLVVFRQ